MIDLLEVSIFAIFFSLGWWTYGALKQFRENRKYHR